MARTVLIACTLVGLAAGHGGMIIPMPRNSIDSELPPWSDGKHPRTGVIEPLPCDCTNGTSPCNSGQSCFWFSQGCSIGCDKCDNDGRRFPNDDHCGKGDSVPRAKRLDDPRYRTANRNATAGSAEDVWKYQPWRAPGVAPVVDSCGMAGGSPTPVFNGGEYNRTIYAKQGDLGSLVLKPRPTGVVWKAGGVATTAWYIAFNHGGGYRYRLCPEGQQLTEECFQAHELDFVGDTHTLTFRDGHTMLINNTVVREGGGVGWMMNPIPIVGVGSDCDDDTGHPCGGCPCGSGYPGGGNDVDGHFPDPTGGLDKHSYSISDSVRVPLLPAGKYVLGWRWDCETSSQVWTSCADITIE